MGFSRTAEYNKRERQDKWPSIKPLIRSLGVRYPHVQLPPRKHSTFIYVMKYSRYLPLWFGEMDKKRQYHSSYPHRSIYHWNVKYSNLDSIVFIEISFPPTSPTPQ